MRYETEAETESERRVSLTSDAMRTVESWTDFGPGQSPASALVGLEFDDPPMSMELIDLAFHFLHRHQ